MSDQTHVIIIMADQLRADALGEHTPNINRLAGDGTVFNRCYCASPLCVPARGAFFTGRYPNETGCLINPWEPLDYHHGLVKSGTPNLYQLLEGDWDSRHTGKQHFYTEDAIDKRPDSPTQWRTLESEYGPFLKANGMPSPGGQAYRGTMAEVAMNRFTRKVTYSIPTTGVYKPGFDYFFDGVIARQSLEAIRERNPARPLLLNAMFLAPHPPLQIPEPWFSMIGDVTLPDNVGVWSDDQSPLQLYNLTGQLGTRYTRADWEKVWPVYLGLVALLDHSVGLIVDELKARRMYDDALILFTADHGEQLGSHCLWQKMCHYEESVHVPLIVKLPESMRDGAVPSTDALVSHIDIFPTLCDFLGRDIPAGVTGLSLKEVIRGGAIPREEVFMQFDGNGARGNFSRAVVNGNYKLNVDQFKDETYFELYDLNADPQEMTNLAFDRPDTVRELLPGLIRYMESTGDRLTITQADYDTFLTGYGQFRK